MSNGGMGWDIMTSADFLFFAILASTQMAKIQHNSNTEKKRAGKVREVRTAYKTAVPSKASKNGKGHGRRVLSDEEIDRLVELATEATILLHRDALKDLEDH